MKHANKFKFGLISAKFRKRKRSIMQKKKRILISALSLNMKIDSDVRYSIEVRYSSASYSIYRCLPRSDQTRRAIS